MDVLAKAIPMDVLVNLLAEAVPVDEAEGVPADEAEAVPVDEAEAVPVDAAEAVPVDAAEAVPADEAEAVPVDAAEAVPADEAEAVPVDAAEAVPADEAESVPVDAAEAVPADEAEAVPVDAAEAVPANEAEAVPADALPLLIGVESEMLECIICQDIAEKIDGFMCKCNVGAQMICEECFFANMTSLTVSDHAIHRLHCCKECNDWTIEEVLGKCAKERVPNVFLYTNSLHNAENNQLMEKLNASTAFFDDRTKSLQERVVKARFKVCDLMCDSCPVCSTKYDGHDACMSISCSICKDKNGEALNFCGWCKDFVGTNPDVHAHVHYCAHRMPRIPGQDEYLFPAPGLSALASNLYKMRQVDKFLVNVSREVSRLVLFYPNLTMHWCTVTDVFYTIHRCAIKSKLNSRMIFTSIALRPLYQTEQLVLAGTG
jgi:hypothetical protein